MLMRRFGRPGLLGLAARTAVVAGTVGVVGGAMSRHQAGRDQEAAEAQAYEQQQQQAATEAAAQQAAAAAQYRPVAAAPPADDAVSQLERLAALQQQGILTPEEFAAQKAKILAG